MNVELRIWADGTANSECYYSARNKKWVFVDFLNHGDTKLVETWVELELYNEDADPDNGLNQATIACDLEDRWGLYVVDADSLEALAGYGTALRVRTVGTCWGDVLDGLAAEEWLGQQGFSVTREVAGEGPNAPA
jgi:hypothetical protein